MKTKPTLAYLTLLFGLLLFTDASAEKKPLPKKIKVLVVDGVNNHDWPRATKIIKGILEESDLFLVEVSTSPSADAPKEMWDNWRPEFKRYNVVISNFNGGHKQDGVRWSKATESDLEEFVARGGGLIVYHAANNSFPEWEAYNKMIALGWRDKSYGPSYHIDKNGETIEVPTGEGLDPGHGAEHDFIVTVNDRTHPIYKDIPATWKHPHEQLTHGQHGPGNMKILSYAWSKDTGENEPMDWVVNYGKGKVYTTMLGHLWKDGPDSAMQCIGFQTILIRATEWVSSGHVSYPVPKNFPTESDLSIRTK